jgi:hypothetical protein
VSFVPAAIGLAALLAANVIAGLALSQRGQIVVLVLSLICQIGTLFVAHRLRAQRLSRESGEYLEAPRWLNRGVLAFGLLACLLFATKRVSEAGVVWFAGHLILQLIWGVAHARAERDRDVSATL